MRRFTAGLTVVALLAAGCGGSSDKKANEAYANNVCNAIGAWEQQVKGIASGFTNDLSRGALQSKVSQVQAASSTLAKQIKAVPPPDTDSGKAAKQQLDQLSSDVTSTTATAKSAIGGLQENASTATVATTLALLAPQVQTLATSAKSAASSLRSASSGLGDAFKSTKSCQSLGG